MATSGVYHDPQTGESFEGDSALARAKQEIMDYEPYLDWHVRIQHKFIQWSDYL